MKLNENDSLRSGAGAQYLSDKVGHPITTRELEGWHKRQIGPRWLNSFPAT
jgi:hypothetical protein